MKWIKKNLYQGNGIVSFVICKGDEHNAYGLGVFDHIEPIFGLYTNNEVNVTSTTIYDDD